MNLKTLLFFAAFFTYQFVSVSPLPNANTCPPQEKTGQQDCGVHADLYVYPDCPPPDPACPPVTPDKSCACNKEDEKDVTEKDSEALKKSGAKSSRQIASRNAPGDEEENENKKGKAATENDDAEDAEDTEDTEDSEESSSPCTPTTTTSEDDKTKKDSSAAPSPCCVDKVKVNFSLKLNRCTNEQVLESAQVTTTTSQYDVDSDSSSKHSASHTKVDGKPEETHQHHHHQQHAASTSGQGSGTVVAASAENKVNETATANNKTSAAIRKGAPFVTALIGSFALYMV